MNVHFLLFWMKGSKIKHKVTKRVRNGSHAIHQIRHLGTLRHIGARSFFVLINQPERLFLRRTPAIGIQRGQNVNVVVNQDSLRSSLRDDFADESHVTARIHFIQEDIHRFIGHTASLLRVLEDVNNVRGGGPSMDVQDQQLHLQPR